MWKSGKRFVVVVVVVVVAVVVGASYCKPIIKTQVSVAISNETSYFLKYISVK